MSNKLPSTSAPYKGELFIKDFQNYTSVILAT